MLKTEATNWKQLLQLTLILAAAFGCTCVALNETLSAIAHSAPLAS